MSNDTQQWVYKLGAITAAVCLLGCFVVMFISIFYFGDGEGLRILGGLTGPILGILGSVAALLAPHSIASAVTAFRTALLGGVASPASPSAAPSVNKPIPVGASLDGPGLDTMDPSGTPQAG